MKLLLLIFLTLCMSGCQEKERLGLTSFTGEAMTIPYRILVRKEMNREENHRVAELIGTTFKEINDIYNKWNPESELSRLNQLNAHQITPLSKNLEAFLLETGKLVSLTSGKFDPTIESVQKIWRKNLQKGQVPNPQELQEASNAVGWDKIHIDDGYFWKDHDLLEIDLGGIAKGFAIDLIVDRLNSSGYPHIYVEWGGEIRTTGRHSEKRPWRIFVNDTGKVDPCGALAIIDMEDFAVASSGDYLQNWVVSGTTYFHILDPQSRHPLIATKGTISSATVIAPTCMLADVLATTAMLFASREEAEIWLQNLNAKSNSLQYWIVVR